MPAVKRKESERKRRYRRICSGIFVIWKQEM